MIWNQLAEKYDSLWVQKYSLEPTRKKVIQCVEDHRKQPGSFLDMGCGTGQLLAELNQKYPQDSFFGCDKSQAMLRIAKQKKLQATLLQLDVSGKELNALPKTSFDVITCCHSFPYYSDKDYVLKGCHDLLKDNGMAIFIQGSVNSFYDKIVMKVIEATAEKADYLSCGDFQKMAEDYFIIKEQFEIREKWFMPSICGFIMRKK